jgi:hypothetical protein
MTLRPFVAAVRITSEGVYDMVIDTQVMATDSNQARLLLERQFGVGNVVTVPVEA